MCFILVSIFQEKTSDRCYFTCNVCFQLAPTQLLSDIQNLTRSPFIYYPTSLETILWSHSQSVHMPLTKVNRGQGTISSFQLFGLTSSFSSQNYPTVLKLNGRGHSQMTSPGILLQSSNRFLWTITCLTSNPRIWDSVWKLQDSFPTCMIRSENALCLFWLWPSGLSQPSFPLLMIYYHQQTAHHCLPMSMLPWVYLLLPGCTSLNAAGPKN